MVTSLLRQLSPLSNPAEQRRVLERLPHDTLPAFADMVDRCGCDVLTAAEPQVLQVNVGKVCNQTCRHCHVDAGPDRRESMSRETVELCLDVLRRTNIGTLDITGGAPELNPHFRHLAEEATALGRHVIDRCNLTILLAKGYEDLPEFLARHRVEIVASLPCYLEANVNKQRGDGVFEKSITALKRLNELGYGRENSKLTLSLVYNPVGPSLPPPQESLEAAYRRELGSRYGVEFTRLYTITNLPISRFLDDLLSQGRLEEYVTKLVQSFNPATLDGLMCRTTISVDWTGRLYDCDFNQMLDLPVSDAVPRHIRDFDVSRFADRPIVTGRHCYGCTAGAGSSCQGRIVGPA
ncbi:MAG TPA: arsenosugar biosynthesis radical SAM (seleno)protein ArsS [Planctomycetaceae bacterium]|nr:arsenosugar biosynthesis radical SAM (seleno)protein ArsS [Planctomycetaceae bacterium]